MGTVAALAINVSLYSTLPFDPIKDFAPVTQAVSATNVLVVHPSVAARTVKEGLFKQGLDASPSTLEQFGAYMKSEIAKWAKVVKASGAKAN